MPSVSKKQHNLMEAVAHSPTFAKKVGIKQSVGQDFAAADKGKKFKGGGMAHDDLAQDKKLIKKAFGMHDKQLHENKKTDLTKLKKGGTTMAKATMGPRTMSKDVEAGSNKLLKFGESAVQKRGHTKGKNLGDSGPTVGIQKMAKGGVAKTVTKEMEYDYKTGKKSFAGSTAKRDAHAEKEGKIVAKHAAYDKDMDGMKKGGKVKKMCKGGMAKGGTASSRADGIATKGKTKGRYC